MHKSRKPALKETELEEELRSCLSGTAVGSQVGIAYSGGLDSTLLLHACSRLFKDQYLFLAFHVDHCLRSPEERMVEQDSMAKTCVSLGIPLFIHVLEPGEINFLAKSKGIGTEAAARELRYGALDRFAESKGAGIVLTAHHKSDWMEGLVMSFARGHWPLRSIPSVRGRYARPLLALDREEIRCLAQDWNLVWHEDSSNSGDGFLRNRVRHAVVPVLEGVFPGLHHGLERSAWLAGLDEAYIQSQLGTLAWQEIDLDLFQEDAPLDQPVKGLVFPYEAFISLPKALAWRFLRQAAVWFISRGLIEAIPDALELLSLYHALSGTSSTVGMIRAGQICGLVRDGQVMLAPRIVSARENDYLVEVKHPGRILIPARVEFTLAQEIVDPDDFPLVIRPVSVWKELGLAGEPTVREAEVLMDRKDLTRESRKTAALARAAGGRMTILILPEEQDVYVWDEKEKFWASNDGVRKVKESEFKL